MNHNCDTILKTVVTAKLGEVKNEIQTYYGHSFYFLYILYQYVISSGDTCTFNGQVTISLSNRERLKVLTS